LDSRSGGAGDNTVIGSAGRLSRTPPALGARVLDDGGGSNGLSDAFAQGIADALNGQFATGGGQGGLGREMGDWGSEDLGNWGGLGGRW
jgi:hypothetical protein